ncbi:hypothetical protein C8J56DRAFT_739726, partial [Mycena floridula]
YRHPSKVVCQGIWEDSTKNLNEHVTKCNPQSTGSNIVDFALSSSYSAAKYCLLLALWVSCHKRPFAIVAD